MSEILANLTDFPTVILDDHVRVVRFDHFVDVGEDKSSRAFDIC